MEAKRNASTTGKIAQDSKPTTFLEWKCPHFSFTNEENMLIDVFEIPLRLDKPVYFAETCVFHQVIETHL
jgi:hypothetical protein